MMTDNQPFRIILNPERDLISCVFIKAWQDIGSKSKRQRQDAVKFLKSPGARYFIGLMDVEEEFYTQWVKGIIDGNE